MSDTFGGNLVVTRLWEEGGELSSGEVVVKEGSEGCLLFCLRKVPRKYLLNQGSQIFPKGWNIAVVGK